MKSEEKEVGVNEQSSGSHLDLKRDEYRQKKKNKSNLGGTL